MPQGRVGQRHELFVQPKAHHPVGGGKDRASEKMAFVRREPWAETAEGLFDVAKQANLLLQVPIGRRRPARHAVFEQGAPSQRMLACERQIGHGQAR